MTAEAADNKYNPYITVGSNHRGDLSIIFSYLPTKEEWIQKYYTEGDTDVTIPVQVKLTRTDGKTATININMIYRGCMMSWAS